eukprot:scaffold101386_cov58-Attheya_sp.AAC.2
MAEDDVHNRSPFTLHRKTSALARRRDRRSELLMNFVADDSDAGSTARAITTAIKEMEEIEDDEQEVEKLEPPVIPGFVARAAISRHDSQSSILTSEESSRPPSPDTPFQQPFSSKETNDKNRVSLEDTSGVNDRTNDDKERPENRKFRRAVGGIISSGRLTKSVMTDAEHIKTDSDAMANATILAWKRGHPISGSVPENESHTPPPEAVEPHRPATLGFERQSRRRSFRRDAILGKGILDSFKQMTENDELSNDEGADITAADGIFSRVDSFSGFSETSTEIFLRKDRSTVPDYKGEINTVFGPLYCDM